MANHFKSIVYKAKHFIATHFLRRRTPEEEDVFVQPGSMHPSAMGPLRKQDFTETNNQALILVLNSVI